MTLNAKTYELKITLSDEMRAKSANIKEQVQTWLVASGVDSFVEGEIDDLDVDHKYDQTLDGYYEELGGDRSPLVIYDYSLEYLEGLKAKLVDAFPGVSAVIGEMDSEVWMEGWKESFKPIYSEKFVVYPPWDKPSDVGNRQYIEIEPGMAFGTGQHATTQVCLQEIESLNSEETGDRLLDVGTGTGVLAIAAYKNGYRNIVATDIDHSAVKATTENAKANACQIESRQDSVPLDDEAGKVVQYDVVVANILFIVLSKIIGDLSKVTRTGGILILSGVLEEQSDEMVSLAKDCGMSLVTKTSKDGWVCLRMTK